MKRRRLSKGEDALWRRATHDVSPLGGPSPQAPPQAPLGVPLGETTRDAMTPVFAAPFVPDRVRAPSPDPGRKARAAKLSAFSAGDPGVERRVKRGKLAVERTLDLHGLREAPARVRLEAFVAQAVREDCRCILIVTGKGRVGADRDHDPFSDKKPAGVIRRRFHEWIDEEPLRSLIVRAAPARAKDGGAGAFYLFLKAGPARR